jgi:anti-sigma regulatory factor (Ser/Thr protein kinase)
LSEPDERVEMDRRFRADPVSAGRARQFVASVLESYGVESVDAGLLTSELATNAVLHGRTDFTVTVALWDARMRVEVRDWNRQLPRSERDLPVDATSGRGLSLVDGIAPAWGIEPVEGGKSVWFELPQVRVNLRRSAPSSAP